MKPTEDKLLTVAEAAEFLRLSPHSLRKWARLGKVQSVKLPGGRLRFWESEILAVLGRPSKDEADGNLHGAPDVP